MNALVGTTALIFTAGVAEGVSVWRNSSSMYPEENIGEQKNIHTMRSLVVPSFIYGTLSVPLTWMGESPSVNWVKRCTFFREIKRDAMTHRDVAAASLNTKNISTLVKHQNTNDSLNTRPIHSTLSNHRRVPTRKMKIGSIITGKTSSSSSDEIVCNNETGIARLNTNDVEPSSLSSIGANTVTNKYEKIISIPTVSDRMRSSYSIIRHEPLPTYFAQCMKRFRVAVLGCSILYGTVTYQISQYNEEMIKREELLYQQSIGRDIKSIQDLVKNIHTRGKNGVSFRLYSDDDEVDSFQTVEMCQEKGIVPILCSNKSHFTPKRMRFGETRYWSLGRRSEWLDIPLNDQCFIGKGSHKLFLVESSVSSSILKGIHFQNGKSEASSSSFYRARLHANKIRAILNRKFGHDIKMKHVVIGTNVKMGHETSIVNDVICLNSLDKMGDKLRSQVEKIHNTNLDDFDQVHDRKKGVLQIPEPSYFPTITIDELGRNVRSFGRSTAYACQKLGRASLKIASSLPTNVNDIGKQIRQLGRVAVEVHASVADHIGKSLRKATHRAIHSIPNSIDVGHIKSIFTKKTTRVVVYSEDPSTVAWVRDVIQDTHNRFQYNWCDTTQENLKCIVNEGDSICIICGSTDDDTINTFLTLCQDKEMAKPNVFAIVMLNQMSSTESLEELILDHHSSFGNTTILCEESIQEELFATTKKSLSTVGGLENSNVSSSTTFLGP